jgi:hypothetical protein
MKYFRRLVLLFTCGLLCNSAVLNAQDKDLALGTSAGIASGYAYRGVERSTTAWQALLDGSFRGWRGRLWSNSPLDSSEPGELQSSLGYVWTTADALTVELSGTHFWYVDAPGEGEAGHSFEAAVQLDWNLHNGWRPGLCFAYDIRYQSIAVEASLGYNLELPDIGTQLEMRVYAGHVAAEEVLPDSNGAAGLSDSYAYYGADVRLPYRVAKHWVLEAKAQITGTINQNQAWSPIGRESGAVGLLNFAVRYEL